MELHCSSRPCLVSSSLSDLVRFSFSTSNFYAFSSSGALSSSIGGLKLSSRARRSARAFKRQQGVVVAGLLPVDPWSPSVDSQSLASQLFAVSLLPYLGFLYHITKSKTAPKLTLFGFYFLLVFVGATIPAGIYAKVHYGTSLSNVDWLHGGAEFFLTLTNLFIVVGLRQALRAGRKAKEEAEVEEEDTVGSAK